MQALFNRLRAGSAPQTLVSDPEAAADLLHQADEALEAAQIRIMQLTEALQGLVELSDATRPRNVAEVRRRLVYAQRLLATGDEIEVAAAESEDETERSTCDAASPDAAASKPAPTSFFISPDQLDAGQVDLDSLERDLDNLKKILKASWAT
jgi:hypothetical protein